MNNIVIVSENPDNGDLMDCLRRECGAGEIIRMNYREFEYWFSSNSAEFYIMDGGGDFRFALQKVTLARVMGRSAGNVVLYNIRNQELGLYEDCFRAGCIYYIGYAPDDYTLLARRVSLLSRGYGKCVIAMETKDAVRGVLQDCGIGRHLSGYSYIYRILVRAVEEHDELYGTLMDWVKELVEQKLVKDTDVGLVYQRVSFTLRNYHADDGTLSPVQKMQNLYSMVISRMNEC